MANIVELGRSRAPGTGAAGGPVRSSIEVQVAARAGECSGVEELRVDVHGRRRHNGVAAGAWRSHAGLAARGSVGPLVITVRGETPSSRRARRRPLRRAGLAATALRTAQLSRREAAPACGRPLTGQLRAAHVCPNRSAVSTAQPGSSRSKDSQISLSLASWLASRRRTGPARVPDRGPCARPSPSAGEAVHHGLVLLGGSVLRVEAHLERATSRRAWAS